MIIGVGVQVIDFVLIDVLGSADVFVYLGVKLVFADDISLVVVLNCRIGTRLVVDWGHTIQGTQIYYNTQWPGSLVDFHFKNYISHTEVE